MRARICPGDLHLVWQDKTPGSEELYNRKSTDGGATWAATKRLTWTSGNSSRPSIAADSFGNLHVVWHDWTPGNAEIYYKNSPDGGATWGASIRLTYTDGTPGNPDVVVNPSGNVQVVWNDATPGNIEIYYRKFTK